MSAARVPPQRAQLENIIIGDASRVRAAEAHLLSPPSTPASVGTILHALRDARFFSVDVLHAPVVQRGVGARRGHPQPQEAWEWLVFDASFHSGPGPGQGPMEARRGDHWAAPRCLRRWTGTRRPKSVDM